MRSPILAVGVVADERLGTARETRCWSQKTLFLTWLYACSRLNTSRSTLSSIGQQMFFRFNLDAPIYVSIFICLSMFAGRIWDLVLE